jgi:hypothetical protein
MEPIDSPAMSTVSVFPRGIKASGLAIKVFPGEEKPAGAISLTQPKITHKGARDKFELDDSEESPELYWQPGRLLGPDDQKRAIISHSPTFTSLSKMDPELLSATSRSHTMRHGRPKGVGLGWGEFDRFREWQQFGRQVRAYAGYEPTDVARTNTCIGQQIHGQRKGMEKVKRRDRPVQV